MYFLYRQDVLPSMPMLAENAIIKKQIPNPFVKNMHSMQMGRKRFWYFMFMSFLFRGFSRVFVEYDYIVNKTIVSKAVLISKVPLYKFLPSKGIHLCYCETIPEARGKGYYPQLLSFIQNDFRSDDLYMVVDEKNISSIRGIEKAGFKRCGKVLKLDNGTFVEVK